jgi:multiple sugar transport system permease protein
MAHAVAAEARLRTSQSRRRKKRDALQGYLFISPWLFGFFALTLIPIIISFCLSFTSYDLLSPPVWTGLDNFKQMFANDPRYWKSVIATLYYAVVAVPLRLATALAVAMALNSSRRGTAFYRALYYAPSIIGDSVAVAIMWRQIFGTNGLLNGLLGLVSLPSDTVWLGSPYFAIWTLIILAAWQFGSPMLIFLAGLKQIPLELYESASIDGASRVKKFFSITLPMLTPVILFNLIMQMINAFQSFTQAYIVSGGQGGPIDSTMFYSLYLYLHGFAYYHMGYAAAMAWVLLLIIAVLTAVTFRGSSSLVTYGSGE